MEVVKYSRNLFIDTEQYHESGDAVNVLVPNEAFSVGKDEMIKLTLEQFEIQQRFYNINKNNNTFYLYDTSSNNYTEIKIAEGNYYTFGTSQAVANSMCKAIFDAIDSVIVSAPTGVTFDTVTRKFTIDMSGAGPPYVSGTTVFVCLLTPPSRQDTLPSNVTSTGAFNDSYEILGAKNERNANYTNPTFAFDRAGDVFTSFFPGSLYTIESIHLSLNLSTQNYSTPSLDANSSASVSIPTQTLARIPTTYHTTMIQTLQPHTITYTDTGAQVFSVYLQNKHLDSMRFRLLDAKGREIPEVSDGQYSNGSMAYKMVIKFSAIEKLENIMPSNFAIDNRQPNFFQNKPF